MARGHWLVKQEPTKYSWAHLVRDGRTYWDGVRNYQARNNLKAMQLGDRVLFYHSVEGQEVVGIAEVAREAYQDPSTTDERWVAVDLVPVKPLKKPVTLEAIKATPALKDVPLIRQSRLSVMALDKAAFDAIVKMGS
jgi:predicted RNA-binding protein with PUA-like domain